MNKEKVEELVKGVVEIEKNAMRKKYDVQSGRGVQFARAKADADAVNGILNLVDEIMEEKEWLPYED